LYKFTYYNAFFSISVYTFSFGSGAGLAISSLLPLKGSTYLYSSGFGGVPQIDPISCLLINYYQINIDEY